LLIVKLVTFTCP